MTPVLLYTLGFYTERAFANVPVAAAGAIFGHTARRQAVDASPIDPAHALDQSIVL